VIGGLIFATVSTLFFVPVMFSIVHRHRGPEPAPQPNPGAIHVPA
jgi:Cu/Ag efflux pump CusA